MIGAAGGLAGRLPDVRQQKRRRAMELGGGAAAGPGPGPDTMGQGGFEGFLRAGKGPRGILG